MLPVFGRKNSNPHDYENALIQWLNSTDVEDRAMAYNFMHDHRVCMQRETLFDQYVQKPCTSDLLKRACDNYFKDKIRSRLLPHYVYVPINGNNILNGHTGTRPLINSSVKLVRILDLNGLKTVFYWAKNQAHNWGSVIRRFPSSQSDHEVLDWLDYIFLHYNAGTFISLVLDILNLYRKQQVFQPTWVTTWDAFSPYIALGPDRWLQVLGVAKSKPCWLILLCYTVREAGTLVRPTQLDAGRYAYHFPSPPAVPLNLGGHPMDLLPASNANTLLPEYIHKQIHHPIDHWTNMGSHFGRANGMVSSNLANQRSAHHKLLNNKYGPTVSTWMVAPI